MKHGLKALIFSLIFVFGIFNVLSLADTEYSLTVIQQGIRVTTRKVPGTNITLGIKPESGVRGWKVEEGDITIDSNNSFIMPEKSVVISAKYELDEYTITYTLNGGANNASNPTTYNEETETITLQAPTKVGYTFIGWTGSNGTTPQTLVIIPKGSIGNKSYTANWQINSYTITWQNYDGTVLKTDTLSYGTTPVYSGITPTRVSTGQYTYTFNGWNPEIKTVTGDTTYTATYTNVTNKYTITATAGNGGTISPVSTEVEYGGSATFTIAQNNGYVLSSLKVDGNAVDTALSYTITNVQKATTITAEFSPISYTISYNGNGATSGTTSSSTHTYNVAKSLTTNGFSKTGYTFLGWSTSSTATSATYTDGQSVSNLTTTNGTTINLYAVWKVVDTITLSTPTKSSVDTDNLSISVRGTLKSGSGNITYKLYVGGSYESSKTGSSGSYVTLSATGLKEYTDYSCYVVATKSEDTSVTATSSSISIKTYCSGTTYSCSGPYVSSQCSKCSGSGGTGYTVTQTSEESGWSSMCNNCFSANGSLQRCSCDAVEIFHCGSCGQTSYGTLGTGGRQGVHTSSCSFNICSSCKGTIAILSNGTVYYVCQHGYGDSHKYCEHGYDSKHN